MRGRSAKPGKLGSHPDNYLLQCLPLPFFRRQNGNLFRLLSLDTLGRTESHPRDSKQTIGVTLTRHSCEGALSQVSRAELAGARPPCFYGVRLCRSTSAAGTNGFPSRAVRAMNLFSRTFESQRKAKRNVLVATRDREGVATGGTYGRFRGV